MTPKGDPRTQKSSQQASLEWLSAEYHDLNGDHIDILEGTPTALEFARIVQISRPVLIKTSSCKWSNDYLISKMGSRPISVAVTPDGRADAITLGPNGKLYFAEPAVEKMTMQCLLGNLSDDKCSDGDGVAVETYYLQSQNGNVYSSGYDSSEFEPLRQDIPSHVAWCTEALGKSPEAVNVWIGDGGSISSIHSADPYENIYTVVRGQKHFTLLPPTDGWCLDERFYPHATYVRNAGNLVLQPSPENSPPVRWASILNHRLPGYIPPEAHPIHISVSENEAIYIPVGWWHHVRQTGITVALNWWYDTEMRGMSWVMLSYLRDMKDVPSGNTDDEGPKSGCVIRAGM
ncbi:Clavaminate synthase-like protein [Lentinula lateritia]|nr:Clavaminate synthase-like protein [Lentinula lateritia]